MLIRFPKGLFALETAPYGITIDPDAIYFRISVNDATLPQRKSIYMKKTDTLLIELESVDVQVQHRIKIQNVFIMPSYHKSPSIIFEVQSTFNDSATLEASTGINRVNATSGAVSILQRGLLTLPELKIQRLTDIRFYFNDPSLKTSSLAVASSSASLSASVSKLNALEFVQNQFVVDTPDKVKVLFLGSTPGALNGEYRILVPVREMVKNPVIFLMIPENLRPEHAGSFVKSALDADLVPEGHSISVEVFVQVSFKMVKAVITVKNIFDMVEIELSGLALPEFFESFGIKNNNSPEATSLNVNQDSVKQNVIENATNSNGARFTPGAKIFKEKMFGASQTTNDASKQKYFSSARPGTKEGFLLKQNSLLEVRLRNVKILDDPRTANFQIFVGKKLEMGSTLSSIQYQMQQKSNYRVKKHDIDLISKTRDFLEVSQVSDSFCFSTLKIKNAGSGLFEDHFNCHFGDESLAYMSEYYKMMDNLDDVILGQFKNNILRKNLHENITFDSEKMYYDFVTKEVLYKDFAAVDMTSKESLFRAMTNLSLWPRQIVKIVQLVDFKDFAIKANNNDPSVILKAKSTESPADSSVLDSSQEAKKSPVDILKKSVSGNPESLMNLYQTSIENVQVFPQLADLPVSVSFDIVSGQLLPKSLSVIFILPARFNFIRRPRYYRSCLIQNQEVLDNYICGSCHLRHNRRMRLDSTGFEKNHQNQIRQGASGGHPILTCAVLFQSQPRCDPKTGTRKRLRGATGIGVPKQSAGSGFRLRGALAVSSVDV